MSNLSNKKTVKTVVIVLIIAFLATAVFFLDYFNLIPKSSYTAEDFRIETVKSSVDFDADSTDDYTDILLGARKDAKNHPKYDGKYGTDSYSKMIESR